MTSATMPATTSATSQTAPATLTRTMSGVRVARPLETVLASRSSSSPARVSIPMTCHVHSSRKRTARLHPAAASDTMGGGERMEIGSPDTEREVEVAPLEEPVPSTAPPAETPAPEPVPA
jgi:hypothetical protein